MKEIALTQGKFALVDDCDYERLDQYKWHAKKLGNTFYAARISSRLDGKQHTIFMHWEVIGKPPKGLQIDHVDGNGLNEQQKNLRFVTNRQNQQNQQNRKNEEKSSQYFGVNWHKSTKKWRAKIQINGAQIHLGLFLEEKEAFLAYKQAVNELGESIIEGASL